MKEDRLWWFGFTVGMILVGTIALASQNEPTAPPYKDDDRPLITVPESRLWDAIRRRADVDDPASMLVADFMDYGHDAHPISEKLIAQYTVALDPTKGIWADHYSTWLKWRDMHPNKTYRDYVYDWDRIREPKGLIAEHKKTFQSLVSKRRIYLDKKNAQYRKEYDKDRVVDKEFFAN